MKACQVTVPGKLFWAGEYAVTQSQQKAIVAAVDAFLCLEIEASDQNEVISDLAEERLTWSRTNAGKIVSTSQGADNFSLIWEGIRLAEQYLFAKYPEIDLGHYRITIKSQLHDPNGQKYGLGSSAAVLVACLRGILQAFSDIQEPLSEEDRLKIFKLAAIAEARLKMKGSFGDLAAASHGGLLLYQNFDRSWFRRAKKTTGQDVLKLLDKNWPGLLIQSLVFPDDWAFYAFWVGQEASTEKILTQQKALLDQTFLAQSQNLVEALSHDLEAEDFSSFAKHLSANQDLIEDQVQSQGSYYASPALNKVINLARQAGLAAKVSGAGQGDCAIAIAPNRASGQAFLQEAQAAALTHLDLDLYYF
ncbi:MULTISPECIES: phosphomevalonate kinase [Aerococcus]|uniref:Phosphomevalonate kinase n=1 Tax=Aerococcus sanguinicola TaxID=119206 RepID=A0A5N1GMR9_9LACT|nr:MULTISPECIES: phosphomevalonate kinase [Aerococcus]KAA9302092.1 phosphomevalonate kinase [Aerococcus sanguinicola]MDK6368479.1 phosphomevalonate kinase [Aerococcus sp. UMB9870]MDK6679562.1 phosphomevalonate kinase [Aerococcus sp. UMB8608]MDK6686406.1 phosphomevalonate kinase [Aerococcus sp. UMB8623]MDK6940972.1 phosphomevalonate kinase [Aerococcus sp. UMB8487]